MIALGLNLMVGLGFSAVIAALLVATPHHRTVRKPHRPHARESDRRKYWGSVYLLLCLRLCLCLCLCLPSASASASASASPAAPKSDVGGSSSSVSTPR